MKKYLLLALLAPFILSCHHHDDEHEHSNCQPREKLGTIKLMALQADKAFSGALEIFPCQKNTTNYFGNYHRNTVSVLNPSCTISKGAIINWGYQLLLPLGTYNMVYWGISNIPTYSACRVKAPGLTLGVDMSTLYWSMAQNNDKTTFMPVFDQVMAVQDVAIGSSGISVNLSRKVAGLNVVIQNSNGSAFDASITSFEVLVGGIAEKINFVTGEPENQTKTVRLALSINSERTTATNVTAMLYPSAAAPSITINVNLANGKTKSYTTNLKSAFEANSMQTVTMLTGDILGSDPSGSSFTVDSWNETSQVIDIPTF